MSFENNLRMIVRPMYDEHLIADTDEIYNDEIVICTDDCVGDSDVKLLKEPSNIVLSCLLRRELVQPGACVHFSDKMRNVNIYDNGFVAYKSVRVVYIDFGKLIFSDGSVRDFFGKRFKQYAIEIPKILYEQSFAFQDSDCVYESRNGDVQLFAYGGMISDDADLSSLGQAFFHVRDVSGELGIAVSDEKFWRKKAIDPYVGGVLCGKVKTRILSPPSCAKRKTLQDVIVGGGISISIASNDGECYRLVSKSYKQKNDKCDIMFEVDRFVDGCCSAF